MMYADAHADLFHEVAHNGADPISGARCRHMSLEGMRRAGQRLQVCSLWTPARLSGREATGYCDAMLAAVRRATQETPRAFRFVRERWELEATVASEGGPIGLVPWIEGGSPLRGELSEFERYANAGVKGIGLVWNHANEIADGCGVSAPRRGLSRFGRELVRAMEARRVIVDLAHMPEPGFWDVIEMASRPVVVTHTGMRALVPITRNVSDAMARAVAASGGFVGIDLYPGHLYEHAFRLCARRATVLDFCDHVVHALNVCGEDHVVIGGDLEGFGDNPEGFEGVEDVPRLAEALVARGVGSRTVEKVMGRNLVERLSEMW